MIDFRKLRVLRVLEHNGTVAATARALHLTPSAVSQQLQQLSKEVGVELLVRRGRGVELTPAARLLLRHADTMFAHWEQARSELNTLVNGATGTLRMCGFASSVGAVLVPAADVIRQNCPNLTVDLLEAPHTECFDLLLAEETDIIVVPVTACPPLSARQLDREVLFDDPQEVAVGPTHPLAKQASVQLTDLSDEVWIATHEDQQRITLAACVAAGFTPRFAHYAEEWTSIAALVSWGFGVSLMPRLAAIPDEYAVVRLPISEGDSPFRRIVACTRKDSSAQPLIRTGVDALHQVTTGLSS